MNTKRQLFIAFCLLLFFLALGTVGYRIIEGYSLLDAFYMAVITISTVGFGEIQPLSEPGRTFTIILILTGVGALAFAAGSVFEILFERASDHNFWKKKMKKKIDTIQNHTIICGGGRVGTSAAMQLQQAGSPFVIIDREVSQQKQRETGYLYVEGDATREADLLRAGIKRASSLLALLGSDPENLFTVLTARELNPTLHIISRTEDGSSERRILRAGADSVISLYDSAGKRVASAILQEDDQLCSKLDDYINVPEPTPLSETQLAEIVGKTVGETEAIFNCSIIGIKDGDKDILLPEKELVINAQHQVITLMRTGNRPQPGKVTRKKKIILIDDNPVIGRLYTRLFQKANFNVITADNGRAGLALIGREQADAVIIDFHLPDMTGLEVSAAIRKDKTNSGLKIFLFTADEELRNREDAVRAGVDKIVIKSPEANEIVATVKETLDS